MRASQSRFTPAQRRRLGVNIEQSETFIGLCGDDKHVLDNVFFGKFKEIISTIYHSDNPVSLCNDVVLGLSESVSADVKQFVNNWLLKSIPSIQSAPDDETAFNTLIPRIVGTQSELAPYIDHISSMVEKVSVQELPSSSPQE